MARAERAEARAEQAEAKFRMLQSSVRPWLEAVTKFEAEQLPSLEAHGEAHLVPVQAVWWTHDTVDSRAMFCEWNETRHGQQSIYKLIRESPTLTNFPTVTQLLQERA